jgi:hypothetical protein
MPTMWAPGSALYCEEVAMRGSVGAGGEGGGENWPAVVVRDSDGQVRFVVQSAAVNYGDALGNRRWLADSSAFVAMVDNGAMQGSGWSRIGYAVVQADGSGLEMLPALPGSDVGSFRAPAYAGAIPHPSDTAWMAFGHLDALDRRTNRWVHANIPADSFPGHIEPWAGREFELSFLLPHGGHGGGGLPSLIAPRISQALPPDSGGELPLRIRGEGDCLNLRAQPSLAAEALTCLVDGSVLTVASPQPAGGQPPPAFVRNDEGSWVHVQWRAGEYGWVSASYLEWV